MEIWDSHVHLFPPEIYRNWEKYAKRDRWFALLTEKPADGRGTEEAWATPEEALACADAAGVRGLVMQGWYWNDPGLMTLHNDFMAQAAKDHPGRLVPFAAINPKFGEAAIAEVQRCAAMGFRGVGELGPGGNGYDFEDPDFLAVLDCARGLGLPVCIHCGEPVGHPSPGKDLTPLAPLPEAAARFPDLKLILAHLGGGLPFYELNPRIRKKLANAVYDLAANPLLYHIRSVKAAVDLAGADRVLFGSDFPLLLYPSKCREMDMTRFVRQVKEESGLAPAELEQVLGGNVKRLLDLE